MTSAVIGQACEFDYSGTQACKALKQLGYEIVLVNSNPATIMTDPETADVTYIEPLTAHGVGRTQNHRITQLFRNGYGFVHRIELLNDGPFTIILE